MTQADKTTMTPETTTKELKTSLVYEEKVIKKIVGHALETVDGLLAVSGGFFSNLKNKTFKSESVTDGVHVEVGKKEVAVDLDVIVEYNKDIPAIAEQIKDVVSQKVAEMTKLSVVELNIRVVDIKTKEEHEADAVTVQEKVESAAHTAGEFASEQSAKAKDALSHGVDAAKTKAAEAKDAVAEVTASRVQ